MKEQEECENGYERGKSPGGGPDWGLQRGLLSTGQLFLASKAGRRGSVKSYNNSAYNHPFKTQID